MQSSRNGKVPHRVLVIGLDGATFDLIYPWLDQLPTLKRLLAEGAHGQLETVIPPLTGPAWISFLTGKNPGKHGIYDFVVRTATSYTGRPINASQRHRDSLWSLLSKAGKRVGVFMVPVTYPPEPVNGFMVTGMLTPAEATDYTYPLELAPELQAAVPSMTLSDSSVMHSLGRENLLVDGLERLTEMMMDATNYLMGRFDWDFYMLVFKETDVAMHWLWRFMVDAKLPYGQHPWHEAGDERLRTALLEVYKRMDRAVAELLEKVGQDTLVILMSDHGAGPLESYFHVNNWLMAEGVMRLKGDFLTRAKRLLYRLGITPVSTYKVLMKLRQGGKVANTMRHRKTTAISMLRKAFLSFDNVNWAKTKAYSLGNYGQLYVNLKGREPQGSVEPGAEYEQVLDDLTAKLKALKDPRTGQPIAGKVYRGTEIYHGASMDVAPDLVFMPDDLKVNGFGLYQFSSHAWMAPTFDRSGGHRMNGILVMRGPGVKAGVELAGARIIDLAPTVLAAMGAPVPSDMDGKVLTEAFVDSYFAGQPIVYSDTPAMTEKMKGKLAGADAFSAEEEEEIKQRLRDLGYMA